MEISHLPFGRQFALNPYRSLSLPMGGMSLGNDWINDTRGDPYPLFSRDENMTETVGGGRYMLSGAKGARLCRLLGAHFFENTYSIALKTLSGKVGIRVEYGGGVIEATLDSAGSVTVQGRDVCHTVPVAVPPTPVFSVTHRAGGVSLYLRGAGECDRLLCDVPLPGDADLCCERVFRTARACLVAETTGEGATVIEALRWYIDGGISHADIKPIRYEDGTVLVQNGRIFLTVSSRREVGQFQTVLSLCPGTADLRMEGVLYFDAGDGRWCDDVASSILYDRKSRRWLIWMCCFSHGHVLGRTSCTADPRFGVQVLDVVPMPQMPPAVQTPQTTGGDPLTAFCGVPGDEDPDLLFWQGRWYLTVCRLDEKRAYRYYRFVSDDPLDGFVYCDRTATGGKTGGMFVRCRDGCAFVCGSDFHRRAVYEIYAWDDFSRSFPLRPDYDDGGFRGWGTVMLLPCGTRARYLWITFDRQRASAYPWSYGNIYLYTTPTLPPEKR